MSVNINIIDDLDNMELMDLAPANETDTIDAADEEFCISLTDNVGLYLKEISKYSILSREDEKNLAVRYKDNGDEVAGNTLIQANLRLVIHFANKFKHKHKFMNLQDLIQEGNVGLLLALKKFDPSKGYKFSYYSSFWIKACIVKFIIENYRMVRIGTTQVQRKLFFNLRKEMERLEKMGIDPTIEMLSKNLSETQKDVTDMLQRLESVDISMEAEYGQSNTPFHCSLSSDNDNAHELLERFEVSSIIRDKLDKLCVNLTKQERVILHRRILIDEPVTLQGIGAELKISKERVRQIEGKLKVKIKDFLVKEFGSKSEILKIAC